MMIIEPSQKLALQLALALKAYVNQGHTDSRLVPMLELRELLRAFTIRATPGQVGTSVDAMSEALDDVAMTPRLLTYQQAAPLLSCSERQVKRLAAAGALPTVRLGRSPRIRTQDLDTYVDQLAHEEPSCRPTK